MIIGNEKYIARLIAGYMNGSLSPKEERDLEVWRKGQPANEEIFQRLSSPEYLGSALARYGGTEVRNARQWDAIAARTTGRKRRIVRRALGYCAAAAVVAVVATALFLLPTGGEAFPDVERVAQQQEHPLLILPDGTSMVLDNEKKGLPLISNTLQDDAGSTAAAETDADDSTARCFHTLKVPRGCTYPLILSDNTVIYLNSESELIFPVKFAANQRRVFLRKGEAYFKVARDEEAPFVVESGPVSVEVLGTAFGVRAREGEQRISTVIESGSVRMAANGTEVTLTANQQGSFGYGSGTIEVGQGDPLYQLAWVRNRLAFDNLPLREIMDELSRTYSFTPVFLDTVAGQIPFSMNVRKPEQFDQVLQLIERTGKVRFEVAQGQVRVGATGEGASGK